MQDELKSVFSNVNDWLKFAEAKNGALVGLNGGAVLSVLFGILLDEKAKLLSGFWKLYFWCFVCCLLIGIVISLYSFMAKLKEPEQDDANIPAIKNLMFFGHVQYFKENEYLDSLSKAKLLDPRPIYSRLETDYANQIIYNSRIAMNKYTLFNQALWFTLAGVMTPVGALALWIVNKK